MLLFVRLPNMVFSADLAFERFDVETGFSGHAARYPLPVAPPIIVHICYVA